MSRINVLVTFTSRDLKAEVIAASVEARPDMNLVEHRCVPVSEVSAILETLAESKQCALVMLGRPGDSDELARQWLSRRADLVVLHVDLVDDVVRISVRDPRLESILSALAGLVHHVGRRGRDRFARIQLATPEEIGTARPLLRTSVEWVHAVLRDAVASASDETSDVRGLAVSGQTLLQSLDANVARISGGTRLEADAALDVALATADADVEPLAAAARAFGLGPVEFRLMVLALAPELDLRFQRCIGFLLDDLSRRAGTITLYHTLLGVARGDLAESPLDSWLVFDVGSGRPAGDEPLRIDPFLAQWLLGERDALANDPVVRRSIRLVPWHGALLLQRHEEREAAATLMRRLLGAGESQWLVLGGDDPAEWRALAELGASAYGVVPIRIETAPLAGLDVLAVEDCARRVGRMARLTGNPPLIDVATATDAGEADDDRLRVFFTTLGNTGCQSAVVCPDPARVARLLGTMTYELSVHAALPPQGRVAAFRAAATGADAYLSEESAAGMVRRFPLSAEGLQHAMFLARSRPKRSDVDDPAVARFVAACKDVASASLSHLAERIEPVFDLDEVVLPADRQQQLIEIVDNVRLAPHVLDGWKFGDQLPYGRGVTALFFGPSGTGKTMAAIGIARRLGIQLLRLDLSRTVSKYIGETEKNIDRVFTDAHRSGSVILIDEAEALLGKRSEVKDAHDRYANIEVAYLLQRMETYEGLAILTTNLRQNIDPAFLRRLRFILEFPRPDVTARERIWRQCLPADSYSLDDAEFRQLARKIDLTGGHIRQITLRAAFIAAAAGEQIGLEHIARAARAEFAKLGMPPVELELSPSRRAA